MGNENFTKSQQAAFNQPAEAQTKSDAKIIHAKIGTIRPGGRLQRDMDQFPRVG